MMNFHDLTLDELPDMHNDKSVVSRNTLQHLYVVIAKTKSMCRYYAEPAHLCRKKESENTLTPSENLEHGSNTQKKQPL
jgi:hypothetical protein